MIPDASTPATLTAARAEPAVPEPAVPEPAVPEPAVRPRHTADSLLEVAATVFTERGYDGTSMENLAAASGITKSSIYHHVSGKETLLRLALDRALDAVFSVLDEAAATEGRAVDRLEHIVRRTAEQLIAALPYVTLLLRVRGNTPTEQWALARRREFDHRVAGLVRAAVADGDLRADLDAGLATRLLFGMINSASEWYRPGGPVSPAQLADTVAGLAFDGLHPRRPG